MSESHSAPVGMTCEADAGSTSNLSTISDTSSVASFRSTGTASSRSGLPRPSGLKQPTKLPVTRMCGNVQKPPVPASPKSNGTNTTIRKLSDDLAKRKLSTADSSVVLTEDTDSFIIGDRVYVGGNKPGQIAYIGETQFAPGDWAGIVLDQPIGKNDGSVGGVRYFQCENKKGIFSRLTRLTRKPLISAYESELEKSISTTPYSYSTAATPRYSVSSSPVRSSVSSPTSPMAKTSFSSPGKSGELKVGDRVIVMSSMGSKAGMLRYLGTTNFAPGDWCGVELDDPLGKNDGSVAGTRYFDCLPNFGLFAPLHKVSKSPTGNRKPSTPSCVMHPGGIKRHGSKESLNSTTTTATAASSIKSTSRRPSSTKPSPVSTNQNKAPLQELLNQKQQHIEQLLKERDLERAEVTRAASQAEHAEHELAVMKQEFLVFKDESTEKTNDYELLIARLQHEKQELTVSLEDERRRFEDLQFRFEEESITRNEFETKLSKIEEKLKETEVLERTNQEAFESESNKLFEAEETLTKVKDENETLKQKLISYEKEFESNAKMKFQFENEGSERNKIIQENMKELEELHVKYKEIEDKNTELNNKIVEIFESNKCSVDKYENDTKVLNEEVNNLKVLLEKSESRCKEFENKALNLITEVNEQKTTQTHQEEDNLRYKKSIDELNEKVKLAEKEIEEKNKIISNLKLVKEDEVKHVKTVMENENIKYSEKEKQFINELKNYENLLKEKSNEIDSLTKDKIELENKLTKKINDLNSELSLKFNDVEQQKSDTNSIISDLKIKHDELTSEKIKIEENAKVIESELNIKLKNLKEDFDNSMESHEKEKLKLTNEIKVKEDELLRLKNTSETSLENLTKLYNGLKEDLKNVRNDHDNVLKDLTNKLQDSESINRMLKEDLRKKDEEMETVKSQLSKSEEQSESLTTSLESSNNMVKDLEGKVNDLNSLLSAASEKCAQLSAHKLKLEDSIATLMNTSSDSSTQLNRLNDELRLKETELDQLRSELYEHSRLSKNNEQQMKQRCDELGYKFNEATESINKFKSELLQKNESYSFLQTEFNDLKEQINVYNVKIEHSILEIREMTSKLHNKDDEIENLSRELETAKTMHSNLRVDLESKIENSKMIENELREAIEISEVEAKNNKKQIDDLNNNVKLLETKVKGLEEIISQKDKKFKEVADTLAKTTSDNLSEKKASDEKIRNLINEITIINETLLAKNSEILDLSKQKSLMCNENSTLKTQLVEVNSKLSDMNNELCKVREELVNSRAQYEELKTKLDEDISKFSDEKEVVAKSFKTKEFELKEVMIELNKLQELSVEYKYCIDEKESKIIEQNKRLESLESDVVVLNNEISVLCSAKSELQQSLDATIAENKERKQSLDTTHKKISETCKKLEVQTKQLLEEKSKLEEKLVASNVEIDKLKSQEYMFKQLQESESVKKESERKRLGSIKIELEGKLKLLMKEIEVLREGERNTADELNAEIDRYKEVNAQLSSKILGMEKRIRELEENPSKRVNEYDAELINLKSQLQESQKEVLELKNTLNKYAVTARNSKNIGGKVDSFEKTMEINSNSTTENLEFDVESLINEQDLTSDAPIKEQSRAGIIKTEMQEQTAPEGVLKENEKILHGQIDFLNSIIVDLQNKNDSLQSRIHHLETGEPDKTSLNGIKTRTVAPRLFCDICDMFDAHDTEDCPTQCTSDSPVPEPAKSYPRGYERPYCESCEIFGHSTSDCDEGETY